MPSGKPEDCLVGIVINKKNEEIVTQQQQVSDALHKCFGSKPTISVVIDGVKALPEDRLVQSVVKIFCMKLISKGMMELLNSFIKLQFYNICCTLHTIMLFIVLLVIFKQ